MRFQLYFGQLQFTEKNQLYSYGCGGEYVLWKQPVQTDIVPFEI